MNDPNTPDWLSEGLGLLENAFGEVMSVVSEQTTGAVSLVRVLLEKWETTSIAAVDTFGRMNTSELAQLEQHLSMSKSELGLASERLLKVVHRMTNDFLPLLTRGIRILDCGLCGISA